MWIVLSINNSRYQCWQISVLIWSIELSINYVSLKSDNITYVEMSYVLAFEQCLALDFIAKVAVIMWLWAKLWIVDSTVIRNRTLFWVIFFQNLNKNHMDPAGMPGTQLSYPLKCQWISIMVWSTSEPSKGQLIFKQNCPAKTSPKINKTKRTQYSILLIFIFFLSLYVDN